MTFFLASQCDQCLEEQKCQAMDKWMFRFKNIMKSYKNRYGPWPDPRLLLTRSKLEVDPHLTRVLFDPKGKMEKFDGFRRNCPNPNHIGLTRPDQTWATKNWLNPGKKFLTWTHHYLKVKPQYTLTTFIFCWSPDDLSCFIDFNQLFSAFCKLDIFLFFSISCRANFRHFLRKNYVYLWNQIVMETFNIFTWILHWILQNKPLFLPPIQVLLEQSLSHPLWDLEA